MRQTGVRLSGFSARKDVDPLVERVCRGIGAYRVDVPMLGLALVRTRLLKRRVCGLLAGTIVARARSTTSDESATSAGRRFIDLGAELAFALPGQAH